MKRILSSLAAIVFVGALAAAGTGAFFSDTETSTANTFTAGAIDLKIDSEQHYNGNVCQNVSTSEDPVYEWVGLADYPVPGTTCDGTWELTDLVPGVHKFFDFDDIKPGDEGENTISIHIDSNEAWMCADINVTSNDDVDCTDPENEAEGAGVCENSLPSAEFDGELAQNINVFTWLDDGSIDGFQNDDSDPQEGDNIWQEGEQPLFSNGVGPLYDAIGGKTYALADASTGFGPLPAGATQYIGLAWCAGDLTIVGPGQLDCDGSTLGNEAQTDEATLDMTFRVEQARNNADFLCTPRVVEETGTVTLDKVVTFSNQQIAGVDVTDYTLHLNGPGGDHILIDETPFPGLTPGVYTVSEVYSGDPANVTSDATFSGSCTEIGTTNTATMTVVPGVNPTCTITNSVTEIIE